MGVQLWIVISLHVIVKEQTIRNELMHYLYGLMRSGSQHVGCGWMDKTSSLTLKILASQGNTLGNTTGCE